MPADVHVEQDAVRAIDVSEFEAEGHALFRNGGGQRPSHLFDGGFQRQGGGGNPGETALYDDTVPRIHLYGKPTDRLRNEFDGEPPGDRLRIEGDGATGQLTLGGDGEPGRLVVVNRSDEPNVTIDGESGITAGGNSTGEGNNFEGKNSDGRTTYRENWESATLNLGARGSEGTIRVFSDEKKETVTLEGKGRLTLDGTHSQKHRNTKGELRLKGDAGGRLSIENMDGDRTFGIGSDVSHDEAAIAIESKFNSSGNPSISFGGHGYHVPISFYNHNDQKTGGINTKEGSMRFISPTTGQDNPLVELTAEYLSFEYGGASSLPWFRLDESELQYAGPNISLELSNSLGVQNWWFSLDESDLAYEGNVDITGTTELRDTITAYADLLPNSSVRGSAQLGSTNNYWGESHAVRWEEMSDRRLKRDIEPCELGLEAVSALEPVSYVERDGGDDARRLGLVAQDVAPVVPEVVTEPTDDEYGSIHYTALVPVLANALDEERTAREAVADRAEAQQDRLEVQREQIETQQAKIEGLERRLERLEAAAESA